MRDGNGVPSVIGVGEAVGEQLMGKVSAFTEGGVGPGKCIPHHRKRMVNRTVMLVTVTCPATPRVCVCVCVCRLRCGLEFS